MGVPADGVLEGRVTWIDRFGNALTNITEEALAAAFARVPPAELEVRIGNLTVSGIARSYGDAPLGALVALIGSSGRLEIAQVGGHAATRYGLGAHDPVVVAVHRRE